MDGFEPHDHIYSVGHDCRGYTCCCMTGGEGRGVPGVVQAGWVAGGAIPVHYPATLQDPYLVYF